MAEEYGRLEERVEQLTKQMGRLELYVENRFDQHERLDDRRFDAALKMVESLKGDVNQQFESINKVFREALAAAISVQEAKNSIIRIGLGAVCGAIITALVGLWLASMFNAAPVKFPQIPPAHSTQELRER